MATLTPQDVVIGGLTMSTATPTASTGDQWANTGKEWLEITNGSGGSITATITSYATAPAGTAVTDKAVTIGNGVTKKIGPFPPSGYTDPTTGLAKVVCSAVSSVTIAVVRLP